MAAATYRCPVVGIDLSPDFIRVGRQLTERVGLAGLVDLRVASGDRIDLADASLDRAMIIHVGMNIPDKPAVFAEVRRVLKPGAIFGVYEQMQVGDGEPTYPLPWAEDERSSFVETAGGVRPGSASRPASSWSTRRTAGRRRPARRDRSRG